MSAKDQAVKILDKAGITINGPHDFDIQVFNERLYSRVLTGGHLALGESYMDGWWDVKALDQFFDKVLRANLESHVKYSWSMIRAYLAATVKNQKTRMGSRKVAERSEERR